MSSTPPKVPLSQRAKRGSTLSSPPSKTMELKSIIPTAPSPTSSQSHILSPTSPGSTTRLFPSTNTSLMLGAAGTSEANTTPLPQSLIESKIMKSWVDNLKGRIDNVNALAIVATFLAAVQAQLISFTYQSNTTRLQQSVNTISFIGLSFDIIGTATGLVSALTLQPDNIRIHDALIRAEESLNTWKDITDSLNAIAVEERAFAGRSISQDAWKDHMAKSRERAQKKAVLESRKKMWEAEEEDRTKELDELRASVVVGNLKGFAPLMMMALGIICFFAAMVGFVISSQPKTVWIPTLSVVVISAMVLPVDALMHKWQPRKAVGNFILSQMKVRQLRKRQKVMDVEQTQADSSDTTKVAS